MSDPSAAGYGQLLPGLDLPPPAYAAAPVQGSDAKVPPLTPPNLHSKRGTPRLALRLGALRRRLHGPQVARSPRWLRLSR